MQADLYSCCICSICYDRAIHLPKLIPTCGHTFCSDCLSQIINQNERHSCPLDRIAFPIAIERAEQFPTNLIVLQVIEEKNKGEFDICQKHEKLKDLICTVDFSVLCETCVEEHKDHAIKMIKEVKTEAQEKIKKMKELLQEQQNNQVEIDILLNDTKKSLATSFRQKFEEMKMLLQQKEKRLFEEICEYLDAQKNKVDLETKIDEKLRKKFEVQICDLSMNALNQRFFRTLSAKIPPFKVNSELGMLYDVTSDLRTNYILQVDDFSTLLKSIITEFKVDYDLSVCTEDSNNNDNSIKIEAINTCKNTSAIAINQFMVNLPPIIIKKEEQEDDLSEITRFLDVDINTNSAIVRFIKSGKELIRKPCLPVIDKLKGANAVILILADEPLTNSHLQALKSLWKLFTEISMLSIRYSHSFHGEDLTLLATDRFWATEKISAFGLFNFSEETGTEESNSLDKNRLLIRLSDAGLKDFSSNIIPSLTGLQYLTIDLGLTSVTDASIGLLLVEVNKLSKNFKLFKLNLHSTDISDKTVEALAKGFCLNSLENFKLSLENCGKVTDASLKLLCSRMDGLSTKFKSLILNLGFTKLTSTSILALNKHILSRTSSLEGLEIILDGLSITDASMIKLLTHIDKNHQTLTRLKLGLNKTKVSDGCIDHFTKQMHLPLLERFSLELKNTCVSDKSMRNFCMKLKELMNNLEYFYLSVRQTKVTGDSLKPLVESFHAGNLARLKHFELDIDDRNESSEVKNMLDAIDLKLINQK